MLFRPTFSYLSDVYENCLIRYLNNPKYKGNLKLALANTSNGRKNLTNDEEVDAYIALYGAPHYYRLHSAFDTLDISKFRGKKIEIFTYGSGPATETCVLIDYLISKNIDLAIKRITLIEPSFTSVQRGEQYVKSTFITYHTGLEIKFINKTLEFLDTKDVTSKIDTVKLHIFSNILDVEQIDLNSLAILLKKSQKGANYFLCISPNYSPAKQQIDKFYYLMSELFQISNISVNAECVKGRLWLMTQGGFVDRQIDRYQRIFMTYAS